jgi:hypothetical protein
MTTPPTVKPTPSSALNLATAIVVAIISSLTVVGLVFILVLPVAYGIDPTGLGTSLGLSKLGKQTADATQNSSSTEQKMAATVSKPVVTDIASGLEPDREDTVNLTIPAKQTLTYNIAMSRDYALTYTWKTDGAPVDQNFIGESTRTDTPKKRKQFGHFSKAHAMKGNGFFVVPFDGNYGWQWANNTDKAVSVWLHTKGAYTVLGQSPSENVVSLN